MLHVAAPEENQARLEFRFVGDECHIRLHRLTRPVQIPYRSFWQVIDSAYLCRTRTDNIKTLYLLFTYCYDISVILSEAKDLCILLAAPKCRGFRCAQDDIMNLSLRALGVSAVNRLSSAFIHGL